MNSILEWALKRIICILFHITRTSFGVGECDCYEIWIAPFVDRIMSTMMKNDDGPMNHELIYNIWTVKETQQSLLYLRRCVHHLFFFSGYYFYYWIETGRYKIVQLCRTTKNAVSSSNTHWASKGRLSPGI